MTSPATGTIPGGGIIPILDGRILHNNNLIFKMLLTQADHTFRPNPAATTTTTTTPETDNN